MTKLSLAFLSVASLFMLLLSSCSDGTQSESSTTADQEKSTTVEVEPKLVFENDYVTVAYVKLAPGESQPTHDGGDRVIYSLTDYSIDWEEKGEKLGTKNWKKGDVHFHDAGKHAALNNGTTSAEWLVFAKKNTELPDCGDNTIENDVNSVSPDFAQILFDNDQFRVTQIILPRGESIPTHSGINRVVYSLSDYNVKYESDTEGEGEEQFTVGHIHWHEACMHSLENVGETEANFLVVSYK